MDAYNRRLDKGLSGSDVPHRLVVTLLYEVRKGFLRGWKIGVLETAESGPTFTVITAANTTNAFSSRIAAARICCAMLGCPPISAR